MAQVIPKDQLIALAKEFGTPLYVYHAEKIKEQYSKLQKAFSKSDARFFILINCSRSVFINISCIVLVQKRQVSSHLEMQSLSLYYTLCLLQDTMNFEYAAFGPYCRE